MVSYYGSPEGVACNALAHCAECNPTNAPNTSAMQHCANMPLVQDLTCQGIVLRM